MPRELHRTETIAASAAIPTMTNGINRTSATLRPYVPLECAEAPPRCVACRHAVDGGGALAGRALAGLGGAVHHRRHEPRACAVRPDDRLDARCALRHRTVADRRSGQLATALRDHPDRPPPN